MTHPIRQVTPILTEAIEERTEEKYEIWVSSKISRQQVYDALRVLREALNQGGHVILVQVNTPQIADKLRGQITELMRANGIGARVVGAQAPLRVRVTFRCSQCGTESSVEGIQQGTEQALANAMQCCAMPMHVKEVQPL